MTPEPFTDEYGTIHVDYSDAGAYAVLSRDEDESFWRMDVNVSFTAASNRAEQNAAARAIITAATELLNRNGDTK